MTENGRTVTTLLSHVVELKGAVGQLAARVGALEDAVRAIANGEPCKPPPAQKWWQDRSVREYVLIVLVALAVAGFDLKDLIAQVIGG